MAGVPLKRLPLHWVPPSMPARLAATPIAVRRASDHAHPALEALESQLSEEGRAVGNLVHAWLRKIALDGLTRWSEARLKNLEKLLRSQLFSQGVPGRRHQVCISKILDCLNNCMKCPKAVWLLSDHPEARCEFAVNGLVDGDLVYAVVDRTFVDHGTRWVVDYKTSQPEAGEETEVFLGREVERYAAQLTTYHGLMQKYDPGHRVKTALYFPMIGAWQELEQ
jgi:ATP-dependent exoDNAse (exonuclease V) beta subunit